MDTETKYGYYDPDGDVDWFPPYTNPLDSMPVATDKGGFDWEDTAPSEYEPPHDETGWFVEKPDESDEIEQEKTIHQKMYEIATSKYNPFSIGGSETLGGSENVMS